MPMKTLCIAILLSSSLAASWQAGSWPQFGGPRGDFNLPAAEFEASWTAGPAVRWSRDLGEGFSGIAVDGGRLFTMYRRGDEEIVVALNAATGQTQWEHADKVSAHTEQDFSQGPGPHATPLITGGRVCAVGATARLRCLNAADGRLVWSTDLVADHGATVVYRGYSSSPLAFGEAVIVQAGGEGRAVMAFDRATGKRLWGSGNYANTNSSPALLEFDGTPQIVAFMADNVAGFDAATGAELWSHPHPQRFDDNIARPIVASNGLLVLTSAMDGGTRGLRIARRDGTWGAEQAWHQTRAGVYYTNAVAAGGLILASSGGLGPTIFSALDPATGDIVWQTRDVLRSQILVVGDRLLVLRDETGALSLATFDRSGVKVVATALLFAESAPSPASLVGTMLYARDRAKIAAIDGKRPPVTARTILAALLAAAGAAVPAGAQDWPQFRGPAGQGHAATEGVPLEWGEARNVAWKTAVPGRGWSSPVVAGGRVWITTAVEDGRDTSLRLIGYDAATGDEALAVEVFRTRGAALLNAKNSHASPTPIVEGNRVYVHFGQEGTAAVTTAGEILWKVRHRWLTQHGGGGSPVLYEDLLIFSADGADAAYVVALDTRTGKERWKTWRRKPWSHAYSTPLVIHAAGRDQLVSTGAGYAAAYDPRTGKEIWRVHYGEGFSNVPRPVFGHGLVFIATGFQQPAIMAVRPDGAGDVTRTHVAWSGTRGAPHTPSPLIAGDHLYLATDGGVVSCLDAPTGGILWQQRMPGGVSASPVMAGGRIYVQSEEGVTTVIAPGPAYAPLASNVLDGPMLASMAVADGAIFIRTATHLYRIAGR